MKKNYLYMTALFMLLSYSSFAQRFENISKNSKQGGQEEMDKMMNQFMGYTKKDLLMTWGMPTSVTSDGDGGEILKFEDIKGAVIQGARVTATHTYLWFFNKQGKAYYWKYDMMWGKL